MDMGVKPITFEEREELDKLRKLQKKEEKDIESEKDSSEVRCDANLTFVGRRKPDCQRHPCAN